MLEIFKMPLLPYQNIVYNTRLTREELVERLNDAVEPKRGLSFSAFKKQKNRKDYEGQVDRNGFKIQRVIQYRNSFLPQITGIFQRGRTGNEVLVKLRLNAFVLVFISLWMGGVAMACLSIIFAMGSAGGIGYFSLIPFGMLLFGYLLTTLTFNYEANKSKKDLQEILKGRVL